MFIDISHLIKLTKSESISMLDVFFKAQTNREQSALSTIDIYYLVSTKYQF